MKRPKDVRSFWAAILSIPAVINHQIKSQQKEDFRLDTRKVQTFLKKRKWWKRQYQRSRWKGNPQTSFFSQQNYIGFLHKHGHVAAYLSRGNCRNTYNGQELQERHVVFLLLQHVLRLVNRRGFLILCIRCLSPTPEGAPRRFHVRGVLLLLGSPFLRHLYVSVVGLEKNEFVSIKKAFQVKTVLEISDDKVINWASWGILNSEGEVEVFPKVVKWKKVEVVIKKN